MTHSIPDQAQRDLALDPKQSFIVQAPAGSGKTELLTQRFLKLLSCVNEPEEILAITFTKKAAAEMRSRIRDALKKAHEEPQPEAPHALKTWTLARNALKQDQEHHWQLLQNPNRLRIKTIDALNTLLTRQLPLLSQFGASPEIMEYPRSLYREAVQALLTQLEDNLAWSKAIAQLMLHLDNNLKNVEKLLIELLGKRDQWLPSILAYQDDRSGEPNHLRQILEDNLKAVIEESLQQLRTLFPKDSVSELLSLLRYASCNLREIDPDSPLLQCADLNALPGTKVEDLNQWLNLASFLITKTDKTFRKSVDKRVGFPSSAQLKSQEAETAALQKENMLQLLEKLGTNEKLYRALLDLLSLPDPTYSENQWATLKALHEVLKMAVAQLHVVFKLTGKIDYTENALAALLALGRADEPTDLALVLDYQLKHILVDEFQDTSSSQYILLSKLVYDWQQDDGRSLFLVGDPMQSIYRFREAEVGLFLRARQQGLGSIDLVPLTLSVNFRSRPRLVDWINHHFYQVMPPFDDIGSGAVSYTRSEGRDKSEEELNEAVKLHHFSNTDRNAQTQGLLELIQQELKEKPEDQMAILVRSRSHLKTLIPALRSAQLAYQAVEIDPLESRPLIQDLIALTRALLYPADHIAWLAILRAPWCGLDLNDLALLAGDREEELIWQRLLNEDLLAKLSVSAKGRLKRVLPILKTASCERHREDLPLWIEKTWLALGGPACLENETELQDAQLFFGLLKKLTQNETSHRLKWSSLEEAIKQLYAQTNTGMDCRIQIMTIHNAKGLEFDTVILPHLEKGSFKSDKPLLAWLERPLINRKTALLLAPIHGTHDSEDKTYEHIREQDKRKTRHEEGRLLYVAATRAKKTLHLCFSLEPQNKDGRYPLPKEGSMLKKLWPSIQTEIGPCQNISTTFEQQRKNLFFKRLKDEWTLPLILKESPERPAHNKMQGFHLLQNTASIIGTVTHTVLQQISRFGLFWWQSKNGQKHQAYLKHLLLHQGLLPSQLQSALEKVEKAIFNTFNDARGLWLFRAWPKAQAEYALTAVIENKAKMLVIDKTFIDDAGLRWIIDYKTTVPEGPDIDSFLEQEKRKYAEKMHEYQQALRNLGPEPIRLGLYFPLVPAWCEWENKIAIN